VLIGQLWPCAGFGISQPLWDRSKMRRRLRFTTIAYELALPQVPLSPTSRVSMRRFALLALFLALVAGCSKKQPPNPDDGGQPAPAPTPTPADIATERGKLLSALKSSNDKTQLDAVDELSAWVDDDPEAVAGLLAMLRDKTTAGLGKTHPTQI